MKKRYYLPLISILFVYHLSHAEIDPHSMAADNRVKVVVFDPNNVISLKGRYGFQTDIVFAPNETIQTVSLGDSSVWQAVPVKNHLFIKPMAGSRSNMTVLTDANTYNFQLDSTNQNAPVTYKLQIIYPTGGYDGNGNANAISTIDPTKINWQYTFTGDKALVPSEAFDSGQMTYFKFKKDGMNKLPAIFIVDKNHNETLVNYHMQGDYLVINAVANQFTLRNGSYVTSIYNDRAIGDWNSIS